MLKNKPPAALRVKAAALMDTKLYKDLWEYLYPIIYRKVKSSPTDFNHPYDLAEEAKDIVQNAIIITAREQRTNPLEYGRTVAINRFKRWYKERFPHKPPLADSELTTMHIQPGRRIEQGDNEAEESADLDGPGGAGPSPDNASLSENIAVPDHWKMIFVGLNDLPPRLRLVLSTYFSIGFPLVEGPPLVGNLNELIAQKIEADTGRIFHPEAIAVDRSRGLNALRAAVRRRYPDATLQ